MKVLKTSKMVLGGLAAFALLTLPGAVAYAATQTSTTLVSGTINPTLSITSAGGTTASPGVDMGTLSPTGATVVSADADDTVTVTTNNSAGYNLKLEMNTGSDANNLVSTTVATDKLAATTDDVANLTTNSWGYRLNGTGNWQTVQENGSADTLVNTTSPSAAAGDDYTVNYGFAADASQPAGTYQGTVLYTATTN